MREHRNTAFAVARDLLTLCECKLCVSEGVNGAHSCEEKAAGWLQRMKGAWIAAAALKYA